MSAAYALPVRSFQRGSLVVVLLKPLQLLLSAPEWLFLATLAAMLLRPPDLTTFPLDRVAFVALLFVVAVRSAVQGLTIRFSATSWPMLLLAALGLYSLLRAPYDAQSWSVYAAKWIVPVALFHVAGHVFRDRDTLHRLETFLLLVLIYLSLISVFSLLGWNAWIYPRFILDESLGIHADRARGPFLQAVANGVSLNLLGLIAIDSHRRGRIRGWVAAGLMMIVPWALLATKTRAVWLAAALSVSYLALFGRPRKVRRAALAICIAALVASSAIFLYSSDVANLSERLQDRSPVEFRTEMYQAGWAMFLEKPWLGWGTETDIQAEIAPRVPSFRPDYYIFHNTYLELAVRHGAIGIALYAWLMWSFLRLGRSADSALEGHFLDGQFRKLWPVFLAVYLINASAVVMNYQFVNGLLFTVAGLLSSQDLRDRCAATEIEGICR